MAEGGRGTGKEITCKTGQSRDREGKENFRALRKRQSRVPCTWSATRPSDEECGMFYFFFSNYFQPPVRVGRLKRSIGGVAETHYVPVCKHVVLGGTRIVCSSI